MFLYRLIKRKEADDTFRNAETALQIYSVLMISNCTGRSFSKLRIIENRLPLSMTQSRLVHLTVMSMECDIPRELNFTAAIKQIHCSKQSEKSILPV